MTLRIRKFMAALVLAFSAPFLSACLPDMGIVADKPSIDVSQMAVAEPAPGAPPLYCRIGRGSALFGREWADFSDTVFTLQRGGHANIKIPRVRSTEQMTVQGFFDGSGQKLIFCPFLKAAPGQRISCFSLYALEDDLRDGIKRTFDIPEAVRGGAITCAYDQKKLRPLVAYAAGGN
jgi:hypothetical protein